MKPNLTIEIKKTSDGEDHQVVVFRGEFDKAGHSEIRDELNKFIDEFSAKTLVFDFSALKFINSEGIGYLMEIHAHLIQRGRKFVIVKVSANIEDVFETIGLKEVIPLYKDLNEFLKK